MLDRALKESETNMSACAECAKQFRTLRGRGWARFTKRDAEGQFFLWRPREGLSATAQSIGTVKSMIGGRRVVGCLIVPKIYSDCVIADLPKT